jgi:hypothetical protein
MKRIHLSLIFGLTFLSSCKKVEINPDFFKGGQCSNNVVKDPVSKSSPYRNLVFSDDFSPGSGTCYTQKLSCTLRLDWWMAGDCPFDDNKPEYASLKNLNKCTWKVWNGYSYWATNKQLTFDARAVEVKDGRLILKILPNPDYDPAKGNCGDKGSNEYALNYMNQNCKLIAGAVDSTDYAAGNSRGRNAKFGRIEMKARYVHTTPTGGAFPAFWMWPSTKGGGTPYSVAENPDYAGEIDILEMDNAAQKNYAIQTYHNWNKDTPGLSASVSKKINIDAEDDHIYGVEWSPTSIKWYIDDCYTFEVKAGDLSTGGDKNRAMKISETGSFIMLWNGALGWKLDLNNKDRLEVDEVRIYE